MISPLKDKVTLGRTRSLTDLQLSSWAIVTAFFSYYKEDMEQIIIIYNRQKV